MYFPQSFLAVVTSSHGQCGFHFVIEKHAFTIIREVQLVKASVCFWETVNGHKRAKNYDFFSSRNRTTASNEDKDFPKFVIIKASEVILKKSRGFALVGEALEFHSSE